jgi:hypothetical protein
VSFYLTLLFSRGVDNVITCIFPYHNGYIPHCESADILRSRPDVPSVLVLPLRGDEVRSI